MSIALIILNVLDFWLTAMLLTKWGESIEVNPLAAWLYAETGLLGIFLFKASMVVITVVIIQLLKHWGRKRTAFALGLLGCSTAAIAVILGIIGNG